MTDIPTSSHLTGEEAKRTARNIGALVLASLLSKGALFIWQLVLAPWLGVLDYGIYGTVGALLAIAMPAASFGMGLILIRDVASAPKKAGHYWSGMLFLQTSLAILAYIGMNLGALGYSETIRGFTAIAGLSLFIDLFGSMGYDLLLSREEMAKASVVEIGHIFLRIGLAILALALGFGLLGVYIATFLSSIVRWIVLWGLNFRAGVYPQFPLDRGTAWQLLVDSSPLAIAAVLSLAYQHADKLMTTGILGEEGTGYLTVAFVINFGVIEMLSTTVLTATYPLMSRVYQAGESTTFRMIIEKLALFMLVISLPLVLTLSIFASDITIPLFGEDFAPTAGILRILIWYTMLTMVANIFSKALLVQNRQRLTLMIRMAGLGLNILLNLILLNHWQDPRGAAVASIAAEGLILVLLIWQFQASGISWQQLLPNLARLLVLGIIVAIVMLMLQDIQFILAMVAGLALYIAGIIVGKILRPDDWDLIYRLVSAMPGGTIVQRYWRRDVSIRW